MTGPGGDQVSVPHAFAIGISAEHRGSVPQLGRLADTACVADRDLSPSGRGFGGNATGNAGTGRGAFGRVVPYSFERAAGRCAVGVIAPGTFIGHRVPLTRPAGRRSPGRGVGVGRHRGGCPGRGGVPYAGAGGIRSRPWLTDT
jgi:hypothetical protein